MTDSLSLSQNPELVRKAMEELYLRMREQKFRYYVPNGKIAEFIRGLGMTMADGRAKHFVHLLSAANGIGKTCFMVNFLANLMWPSGNKYFDVPLLKNWPYLKKIRIVTSHTAVEQELIPEMENWFPIGRYERTKGDRHYYAHWKTDTGWELDIMTFDQPVKEFESVNKGLILIDEPPPYGVYKACISRLRRGGIMMVVETPLEGAGFLYDEIIGKESVCSEHGHYCDSAFKNFYMEAEMEDACTIHGIRGHLAHEDIERIIGQYDEEEKQARVYGKSQHLVGLVLKKFNRAVHVVKPFPITYEDFAVYQFLDPHPRLPDAVSWIAVDKYNNYFVVDELWVHGNTREIAQRIKQKDSIYRIIERIADPSLFADNKDKHAGSKAIDWATEFAEFGLYYTPGTKQRELANRALQDALDYEILVDGVNREFSKKPKLFIFDSCPRTIYEIEHWRWDEYTGRMADKKDKKATPMDKDDHFIENIGRFVLKKPGFVEALHEGWNNTNTEVNDDPYG